MGKIRKNNSRQAPIVELLEPRVLFSADSLSLLGGALVPDELVESNNLLELHPDTLIADTNLTDTNVESDQVEVVFIDSRVPELQSIIDDITKNKSSSVSIIVIDQSDSGVQVINNTLAQYQSVDSVHLVSHSLGTGIRIGSDFISSGSLDEHADAIASWGNQLSEQADLLIYGCNLGASEQGLDLMNELADMTGSDVAVSSNDTGHESLGADWVLETTSGVIETKLLVSASLQENWENKLTEWDATTRELTISVTDDHALDLSSASIRYNSIDDLVADFEAGNGDISLREAIIAANNDTNATPVTINLLANANYILDIADTGTGDENSSYTGDLDITDNINIVGNGSEIKADAIANTQEMRVLDVHTGSTVDLSGLTLTGGITQDSGGGLRIEQSVVALTDVTIDTNQSLNGNGGGIYSNNAKLKITDSTISNNDAFLDGGGVMTSNGPSTEFVNVAVMNNSAGVSGGGINADSVLTLTNSTIIESNSAKYGAGLFVNSSGNVAASNTTFDNNTATSNGGGMFVLGTMSIQDESTVSGNTAAANGGGLYISGEVKISKTTIENNTATNATGGGIHMNSATLVIDDSIVNGNKAENGSGGGLKAWGTITVTNSTFAYNIAGNGGAITYQDSVDAVIKNSTFFQNTAINDGGAIAAADSNLYIQNSTLAENLAGDNAGAIEIDGDNATVTLFNSIVSDNIAENEFRGISTGYYQLAPGVESDGFNVIENDALEDETHFTIGAHISDIIEPNGSAYVVDAKLSSILESVNGSYSQHLQLQADSDAIDAGSGTSRIDAYGITSNEFVDAGAVEYQSETPTTKIFWIDKDDFSVYRMNENGRALQQIIAAPSDINGFGQEIIDIAYDDKTRQLFLVSHLPDSTDGTSKIYSTDADGAQSFNSILSLNGSAAIGSTSLPDDHVTYAISVENTDDPTSENILHIALHATTDNNFSLISYNIPSTGDIWQTTYTDNTSMVGIEQGDIDKASTIYVDSDLGTTGDTAIVWGDSGDGTENGHFYTVINDSADPAGVLIVDATDDSRIPNDEVNGVAFNTDDTSSYYAINNSLIQIYYPNDGTEEVLSFTGGTNATFNDIAYDSEKERLWFVDEGTAANSDGVIAYLDSNLENLSTEITVSQSPYSLTFASLAAVNSAPTINTASTATLQVKENDELEVIDNTLLEYVDIGASGATPTADIVYLITQFPEHGSLYIDGAEILPNSPTTQGWHFTQEVIDDGRLSYTQNGDEVTTDSFAYTVSDSSATSDDVEGTFNIDITLVNDAPIITVSGLAQNYLDTDSNLVIGAVDVTDPDHISGNIGIVLTDELGNEHPYLMLDGTNIKQKPGVYFPPGSLTFMITATDGLGLSSSEILTTNITDTPQAPVLDTNNPTVGYINENQLGELVDSSTGGAALVAFSATDPDQDTLVYSIENDGGYPNTFAIVNGKIELISEIDFESLADPLSPIDLKIKVSDGALSSTFDFQVYIMDVNDAPVMNLDNPNNGYLPENSTGPLLHASFNGLFNNGSNLVIDDVAEFLATDQDNDNLIYSISDDGGYPNTFELVDNTITLIRPLDFETDATSINLEIEVSDGTLTDTLLFTFLTADVNEIPTSVTPSETMYMAENTTGVVFDSTGALMSEISFIDQEAPASALTYTLQDTGPASQYFSLVGNQILLDTPLSFEDYPGIIGLIVDVSDGTNIVEHQINVIITDENDLPTFQSGTTTAQFEENGDGILIDATGAEMEGISYADEDINDLLSYSIDTTTSTEASMFSLNSSNQLVIAPNNGFDFENLGINPIPVTINVFDGTDTVKHIVMVTITDVNEMPTLQTGAITAQIAENTNGILVDASGNEMEGLDYSDDGTDRGLTYSIDTTTSPEAAMFSLNNDNQLVVEPGNTFDFEDITSNPIPISINVFDGTNTAVHTVMVSIIDENEIPTLQAGATTAQILENTDGILVDAFGNEMEGLDYADDGTDGELTYSIDTTTSPEAALFSLNNDNQLVVAPGNTFDLESLTINPVPVSVNIFDGTNTVTHIVMVTIIDENEIPTLQTGATTAQIAENTDGILIDASGEEMEGIDYTDDGTDSGLTYSIDTTTSPEAAMFSLNNDNQLVLTPGNAIDFDSLALNPIPITIEVFDGTNTVEHLVSVTITDENEAPVVVAGATAAQIEENKTGTLEDVLGTEMIGVIADDEDANTNLNYSIKPNLSVPEADLFSINDNGQLVLDDGNEFDYDTMSPSSFTLTVEISDGVNVIEHDVLVNINNVNEAPIVEPIPAGMTVSAEQPLSLAEIVVTDPDNDEISYEVTQSSGESLPDWLVFDASTNTLTTIGDVPDNIDNIELLLAADDNNGAQSTAPFSINIERPPEPPAAALPDEPIVDEPEIDLVVETEAVNLDENAPAPAKPVENKEEPTEETSELTEDIQISDSVDQIDLSRLITPLTKVSLLSIDITDNSITSINRSIVVNQLQSFDSQVNWLNLSDAFSQPSDVAFTELSYEFDRQREEVAERAANSKTLIGSSFTFSSGLSVGYLLWLIRGGTLMGSVLSSLPAWRLVDPLPVLGSLGDDFDDDDESLESMVDNDDDENESDLQTDQSAVQTV